MGKFSIDEIMTIVEAAQKYDINEETLRSKLKQTVSGKEKIAAWIQQGLVRQSGKTWLLTDEFIQSTFLKK